LLLWYQVTSDVALLDLVLCYQVASGVTLVDLLLWYNVTLDAALVHLLLWYHATSDVVVISLEGQRHRQLLSSEDGMIYPCVLDYDKSTNRLLVVNESKSAYLFDVTKRE
jgi:hypothetical protein